MSFKLVGSQLKMDKRGGRLLRQAVVVGALREDFMLLI